MSLYLVQGIPSISYGWNFCLRGYINQTGKELVKWLLVIVLKRA
jgi:hypothetical protein